MAPMAIRKTVMAPFQGLWAGAACNPGRCPGLVYLALAGLHVVAAVATRRWSSTLPTRDDTRKRDGGTEIATPAFDGLAMANWSR
jgi:hypothetical protein